MERFLTKFDRGRLIIAGGGHGSLFPIYLATHAAKLTGCGMVVNIVPLELIATLEAMNPLCKIYATDAIFSKKKDGLKILEDLFQHSKALVMGPGMDWESKQKREFVSFCLCYHLPIVIDSDALDAINGNNILRRNNRKAETVIVVANFNEGIKLLGRKLGDQKRRRMNKKDIIQELGAFASLNSCYVLHKGYGFILFSPDGTARKLSVKSIPQMATTGMGDILAAFIGGFVATGFSPTKAIELSVALRQKAAELCLKENPGAMSVFPQDVISHTLMTLGKLRKQFSRLRRR